MDASCMPPDLGRNTAAWLASAREHLLVVSNSDVPVRMRCFHGQRAVELSLKALLLHHGVEYPLSHSLHRLIAALPLEVPEHVNEAAQLTGYAVEEMYPDTFTELDSDHADAAVALAEGVVEWAASIIEPEVAE